MPNYAVIVENDITQWADETGVRYHFPRRYLRFVSPGTRLLHYKGRLQKKGTETKRLSPVPHYFALSTAGRHYPDASSRKGDLFMEIEEFEPFNDPVPHRIGGATLENIPEARKSNFWRDGVRPTTFEVFRRIGSLAGFFVDEHAEEDGVDDQTLTTSMEEGGRRRMYGTRIERRPQLRAAALRIHGTTCFACEKQMSDLYGKVAEGYIQIHHKRPLSASGATVVSAERDLVPLCPNCHSVAHLNNSIRSVNEIRRLLGKPPRESCD